MPTLLAMTLTFYFLHCTIKLCITTTIKRRTIFAILVLVGLLSYPTIRLGHLATVTVFLIGVKGISK